MQILEKCVWVGNSMIKVMDVENISQTVSKIPRWWFLQWQVQNIVQLWCVMGVNGLSWSFVNGWVPSLTFRLNFMDLLVIGMCH